jgi:tRNA(Ile)-lysidine synthase
MSLRVSWNLVSSTRQKSLTLQGTNYLPVSLNSDVLKLLKQGKNLLAFSGGSDSSALFHLLLEHGVDFDVIHVNYNTREQSHDEQQHVEKLSKQNHKKYFVKSVTLPSSNFEHRARSLRYTFFDEIIQKESYTNLITAHQLNDRLEWFLMQLSKGAGLPELLGMQSVTKKDNYHIVRPILHVNSEEIMNYLQTNTIKYFMDQSNTDTYFKRNHFREHYSNALIHDYSHAIAQSFQFLEEDLKLIYQSHTILQIHQLYYFKITSHRRSVLLDIDKILKQCGYLLGQHEKNLLKTKDTLVVGRRFIVSITETFCFVAPYMTPVMSRDFKEQCRLLKIEPKLRGYLFNDTKSFETLKLLL